MMRQSNDASDEEGGESDRDMDHDRGTHSNLVQSVKGSADPQGFGLSDAVAIALYELYVEKKNSLRDTVQKSRAATGEKINEKMAGRYVRANGWTRSPRYYAQRSTFSRLNQANFAEAKAKREGRI